MSPAKKFEFALIIGCLLLFVVTAFPDPVRSDAQSRCAFFEIIYEVSLRPFTGAVARNEVPAGDPRGYLLRSHGPGYPKALYAARSTDSDNKAQHCFWVGQDFQSPHFDVGNEDRKLFAASPGAPISAPTVATALVSVPPISLELSDVAMARAIQNEIKHRLPIDQPEILLTKQVQLGTDELVDRLLTVMQPGAAPGNSLRQRVSHVVATKVDDAKTVTLHVRVSAVYYGKIFVANFDIAGAFDAARQMAREGRYEDALDMLDNVLEAFPDYRRAQELQRRLAVWVNNGAVPAKLSGTVTFPQGYPTEDQRSFWQSFHSGSVSLKPADATSGLSAHIAPVTEGQFQVNLPASVYEMTVAVPGFHEVKKNITLQGATRVNVNLAAP